MEAKRSLLRVAPSAASKSAHHVVVVGAGFAGLSCVDALAGAPVRVTLIDQRNHHTFQPLLYQVATASLPTSEIGWPVRFLMRRRPEVETVLATVVGVDPVGRRVQLAGGAALSWDTLVLATGARHSYFGHDDWEPFAPGLKTLEDAAEIRRRILMAFEQAECERDPARRSALLTFVVIGGGATGVELAGAIAELARSALPRDFRHIDTRAARVTLVEAGPRLLPAFPERLSEYTHAALERLGVTIALGEPVTHCDANGVRLGDVHIAARTVIWAAGVQASPAAEWLNAPADRGGRLRVTPQLTAPGHDDIYVVGDTALVLSPDGKPAPGAAPAAKQQGRHVAQCIRAHVSGERHPGAYRYREVASLATIGKRAAVISWGRLRLRGALAWWIWGVAHIYFLIGLRNRLSVALSWAWIHALNQRSSRLILHPRPGRAGEAPRRDMAPLIRPAQVSGEGR